MSGKPAASPDSPPDNPQRHVGESRVQFALSRSQELDIDVTGFYYTDHDYQSVQLYVRAGGANFTFSGTPAQARELAGALIKAADAVQSAAPPATAPEGRVA